MEWWTEHSAYMDFFGKCNSYFGQSKLHRSDSARLFGWNKHFKYTLSDTAGTTLCSEHRRV